MPKLFDGPADAQVILEENGRLVGLNGNFHLDCVSFDFSQTFREFLKLLGIHLENVGKFARAIEEISKNGTSSILNCN